MKNDITQDELTEMQKKFDGDAVYCRICGKSIWYKNTKAYVNKNTIKYIGTTYKTSKMILGQQYNLTVCEKCMCEKYNDFSNKNVGRIFNTCNKFTAYGFDVSDEIIKKVNQNKSITLDNFIKKYGETLGSQLFEEYRKKQAYTNTFEYKSKKYGWSINDFSNYNKSRAVTLDNLIEKYGKENGVKIYNAYVEKQRMTKSKEYVIEKYGLDYWNSLCKKKSTSLENYIIRYGENDGIAKYEDALKRHPKFVSNMATNFFQKLINDNKDLFDGLKIYYGKEKEFGFYDKQTKNYYFIDFLIYDLKIAIEFNGDFFHANPKFYEPNFSNFWYTDKTAKEIWKNDETKINAIKRMGFDIFIVWESDMNDELTKNNIINFIKQRKNEKHI